MRGTLSALKAADAEKSVQRVVVTASFACVVEPHEPGTYTFTEKDWNEYSIKQVRWRRSLTRSRLPRTSGNSG